ncbi:hypothetical protein HDV57DRAFT_406412 [Trichoderma longibrachiatum]
MGEVVSGLLSALGCPIQASFFMFFHVAIKCLLLFILSYRMEGILDIDVLTCRYHVREDNELFVVIVSSMVSLSLNAHLSVVPCSPNAALLAIP